MAWGQTGTKITWANPNYVADSAKQSGGWYANKDTGSVDQWWAGGAPQQQNQTQQSSSGQSSNSFSNPVNFAQTTQDALSMLQKNNQPVIDSLNKYGDQLKQSYATQKQGLQSQISPLTDRYNALLSQIKGNQTTSENRQLVTTRGEIAKRGIPLTSTIADQEITNAVNPITQQYTDLSKQTVASQNQDIAGINAAIANLAPQEQAALGQVATQIAQVNGGNTKDAISTALSLMQNAQTQQQQNFTNNITMQELALKQKAANDTSSTDWTKYLTGNEVGQNADGTYMTNDVSNLAKNAGSGFITIDPNRKPVVTETQPENNNFLSKALSWLNPGKSWADSQVKL
jgi:hypothetical protein